MTEPARLAIISFTGAQATGKTTTFKALADSINADADEDPQVHRPVLIESVSTRWQAGEAARREKSGLKPLTCYDDINRLGLRERCQRELGVMLMMDIQEAVAAMKLPAGGQGYILVDRWFCDIATYTTQELGPKDGQKKIKVSEALNRNLLKHYEQLQPRIAMLAGRAGLSVQTLHILVPRSDAITGDADDKSNRATTDADDWQRICLDRHWTGFTARGNTLRLDCTGLEDRVQRVRQRLSELRY